MIKCSSLFNLLNLEKSNLLYLFISVIKYLLLIIKKKHFILFNHLIFRCKPYIQSSEIYLTSVFHFWAEKLPIPARRAALQLLGEFLIPFLFSAVKVLRISWVCIIPFLFVNIFINANHEFSLLVLSWSWLYYMHIYCLLMNDIWEIFMAIDYSHPDPESALQLLYLM